MRRIRFSGASSAALLAVAIILALPGSSSAQQGAFQTRLKSFNEVPSISSTGAGSFNAQLSDDGTSLSYTLTYSGLSAPVTQSHIHLGQQHTNGAIMVFLCQTASNPDPTGLAPQCVNEGTVQGTITSANIIQAGGQGIGNGEFDEFVLALQGSSGYANVHTTNFPSGEIRGVVASR